VIISFVPNKLKRQIPFQRQPLIWRALQVLDEANDFAFAGDTPAATAVLLPD
jgi:hypothetical protein